MMTDAEATFAIAVFIVLGVLAVAILARWWP